MSRILVIGGYGGFGARLSRRLAGQGHNLLVAGRSIEHARRFCADLPGSTPLAVDRDRPLGPALASQRPDLVIDAAGPFQRSSYAVAEACIAERIPYLDLADARDFVTGINVLDADARTAGVAVVAGASSVPALSGAAVRALTQGMDEVRQIDMAITASNRAGAGPSVTRAILSYVGQPIRLWRGRRWVTVYGWQDLRKARFVAADGTAFSRWVALADVPDHQLLPAALPGAPAITFRAGTELAFQNLFLWLVSWPVRWGWLRTMAGAAWLSGLQRLTIRLGGERSAMEVVVRGRAGGSGVVRRWTLVADRGDGPEIPTLAAALIADDMLAGRIAPGARDASDLLALDRFEPSFAGLAIVHRIVEDELPPPLYARLMGPAFDALPATIRDLHDLVGDDGASGKGVVTRGRHPLAKLIGRMMRFPPVGDHDLQVSFAERDGIETWTRDFGGHAFSSQLGGRDDMLIERFGPLRFGFTLAGNADGLTMRLRRWSVLGIVMPLALAPQVGAREWQEDGRFRFEVAIALPLVGEIVGYSGWLSR